MGKGYIFDHPLIQHKLSLMRDVHTGAKEFRELLEEISMLMVYEVTRDLPTKEVEIETPLRQDQGQAPQRQEGGHCCPIPRAGLGMVDGVAKLRIPGGADSAISACIVIRKRCSRWKIGKLPADSESRELLAVLNLDAGYGWDASAAITFLKQRNCKHIRLVNLIAAPEEHPARAKGPSRRGIHVAVCDEKLNDTAYIVPGLGDAVNRSLSNEEAGQEQPREAFELPRLFLGMGLFLGMNTCQSTLELGFSNGKVAILVVL